MKTNLILKTAVIAAFCFSGINSFAQDARMGFKGGLNVSNLYINDIDDEQARLGFNVGLYGQVFSSDAIAIQPELLFSTKGSKAMYRAGLIDQEVQYNLNYLDLPVLVVFKVGESAELHLGAYGSFLLNANVDFKGDLVNGTEEINRKDLHSFDYGLVGGLGFNFGVVQLGARYNLGLAKIAFSQEAENVIGDSKNSVFQLYMAVNLAN